MKLLQTDPLLNEKINKYGCYLMSLCAIISDKYRHEYTHTDINNLYDCLLIGGSIDEDCYVMAPDTVLKYAKKLAIGNYERILQVGIQDDKGKRYWSWVKGDKVDYIVEKWRTVNGNNHFVLPDYDPNPNCKRSKKLASIYYRVYTA